MTYGYEAFQLSDIFKMSIQFIGWQMQIRLRRKECEKSGFLLNSFAQVISHSFAGDLNGTFGSMSKLLYDHWIIPHCYSSFSKGHRGFLSSYLRGQPKEQWKRLLICSICWFLCCKSSNHGQFQAISSWRAAWKFLKIYSLIL